MNVHLSPRKSDVLRTLSVLIGILGLSVGASAQEFSYNGDNGPGFWSELNAAWAACAGDGMSQSPINISRVHPDRRLKPLDLLTYPTSVDIFNNGHTIEQRYEDTGTQIHWNHLVYDLNQFHFHTLSEHTVEGNHAVMELHAVFSEPGGTNLVIGQLFDVGHSQRKNTFIQTLIDAGLPARNGDETMTGDTINIADGFVNTRTYYTYSGSLTTPPCSEVVTWVVLKDRAVISTAQYEAFRRILGNNFRPIQDKAGRDVRVTVGGHGHGGWPR